jgi:two-component system chemotaxis response regulator CheB
MTRLLVVDDSSFVRKAIRHALHTHPEIEIAGEAASGAEALDLIVRLEPDVVTLDVAMPGLDGLETLRRLLEQRPDLPVIMLSAHTRQGAAAALDALALGAVDFIDKASLNLMDLDRLGRELAERIEALSRGGGGHRVPRSRSRRSRRLAGVDLERAELCVIGASTGGPAALQRLLERLPASFPLPIAVVQHMPVGFTRPFAERLDGLCRLEVREAREGDVLRPGRVLVAPAGRHLRISPRLTAVLSDEPREARHIPSVDVLMLSAVRARPGRVLGILLTGMGDDGAEGLRAIRAQGGITLAESEESCAVYGMPRAAVERGAVQHVLALEEIGDVLEEAGSAPR